ALTSKCLLLESMCAPSGGIELHLREEPRVEDQSLTDMAWYPSENSLVKMLYGVGFAKVYRVVPLPDHDDFRETSQHVRRRTVLLATLAPIDVAGFRLMPEPREQQDPWSKVQGRKSGFARRLWRFAKSPIRTKYITLAMRAGRRRPNFSIPWRLPFGSWWLLERGALDHQLILGAFELAERRFVEQFLERGMTVLDIGAHHGLYTLLVCKRVGHEGTVVAFEPSERERCRLHRHLRWNRCKNVRVLPCALGSENHS